MFCSKVTLGKSVEWVGLGIMGEAVGLTLFIMFNSVTFRVSKMEHSSAYVTDNS